VTSVEDSPPADPTATRDLPLAETGGHALIRPRRGGFGGAWDDLRGFGLLRHTPYGLAPVFIIALVGFIGSFDDAAWGLAGPEFLKHGLSVATIVTLSQEIGFVGIGAGLYLGWYSDRGNRVGLFGIGTIISGIAAMGSAIRFKASTIGIARVGDTVASDAAGAPQFSLLADYYPPETRGRAFAFTSTLTGIAGLVASVSAAELFIHLGLARGFEIIGATIALSGILVLAVLRNPSRGYFERLEMGADEAQALIEEEPLSFGEAWRSAWAVQTLRRFFVASMIGTLADAPLALLVPLFQAEKYGLGLLGRALIATPATAVGLVAGLYGGSLIDRIGRDRPERVTYLFGLAQALSVVGLLGLALHPPIAVLVVVSCVLTIPAAVASIGQLAIISQVIPPNIRSQALSIGVLAAIPGYLFGFSVAFIVKHYYGYTDTFYYLMPFYVISGIVFAGAAPFFESDRRRARSSMIAREKWGAAKAAGSSQLLVCTDVDVHYGSVQILFGLDLVVDEGEIIALLGTNGAGKSTLLRAISGTQEATNGAIVFDGREITHSPPHENAKRGVINVPGGKGVFPNLTVSENLLLGTWMIDDPAEVKVRMNQVLDLFPVLRDRADAPANLLSGGEQQMVSLAQAFLGNPKLLMIDELSLGLSPVVVGQLIEIVRQIHALGTTIIVVEQSVNVALQIAERAIFMEKGEIKFDGPTADLLARPDILRAIYVKGTGALTDPSSGLATRRTADRTDARPVLELNGVVKHFGGIFAVDGVDLTLADGEVLGVIGPNGSGKTTLFELISGYQPLDAGTILYEGVDISGWGPEQRAQNGLIRRFQDARLFPSLTVFETLLVALEFKHEVKSTALAAISAPPSRRAERRLRARAERLIQLLDLDSYRDKFVKELSTGLRRIVDLACVLAAEPRVLLLDEPSSGVAQAEAEGLAPLLRRVRFETGCSILIIEHDMPLISAVSDDLVALEQGRVLLRGTPEEVLNDERVIESYLGTSEAAVKRSGGLA